MKKLLLLLAVLLLKVPVFAQYCEIKGKVLPQVKVKGNIAALFQVQNGETKLLSKIPLADDGSFNFLFKPTYEGFYSIGVPEIDKPGKFLTLYLKKGDLVQLTVDTLQAQFTGKQSPENTVLANWQKITQPLSKYAMTTNYKQLFSALNNAAGKSDDFRKTVKTNNVTFNNLVKRFTYFDLDNFALTYILLPNSASISEQAYPSYYKSIEVKNKFPNDEVLKMPFGATLLGNYADFTSRKKDLSIDERLSHFSTDNQKGVYLFHRVTGRIKTYEQYEEVSAKYGKYFQSPAQKTFLEDLGAKYYDTKSGGKASDFNYPDKDGKMVSLSDFKGKVVLVDIWATWCGPCKMEIPHLKTLEKELHGTDVVILSISVDAERDKEKWLSMIKEKELGGIQLFASGMNSKIAKDYKISSIPRFMVFDRKGNIVSADSVRPSEGSKLKDLLLAEHKKNTI